MARSGIFKEKKVKLKNDIEVFLNEIWKKNVLKVLSMIVHGCSCCVYLQCIGHYDWAV